MLLPSRQAAAFAAGWVSLAIALLSPLHPLGELLFAAHMTQHEILMLVAALSRLIYELVTDGEGK